MYATRNILVSFPAYRIIAVSDEEFPLILAETANVKHIYTVVQKKRSHYIILYKQLKNVRIFQETCEGVSKVHNNILGELYLL